MKQDLCRKVHLVCGGHVVNADGPPACAGTVKGGSVCLLFLIAAANDLDVSTGNIGNVLSMPKCQRKCVVMLDLSLVKKWAR